MLITNDSLSLIKPDFMTIFFILEGLFGSDRENEPSLSFRAATHVSGSQSSVLEGRQ